MYFLLGWIIILTVFCGLYFGFLRSWQMNWGASAEDINRHMAGDDLLDKPAFNSTRAVNIKASPEQIWPWIVQMGYKRGGFYGFDILDNGGIPSADFILPEFQNLKEGDIISFGGASVKVEKMIPDSSMLWVFQKGSGAWENATWSWGLYRMDDTHTRLVSRLRQKKDTDSFSKAVIWALLDMTEVIMMRTTLKGIKRRAQIPANRIRGRKHE
jgi:hypothetical protein